MELQVLEQNSNVIIEAFKNEGGAQSLFNKIAEQARSIVPDLTTGKGRDAIKSMARKVASTKTAFDAHGKELKEQYTVITSKIDADRKLFRDQCDALRDEIRKPLTDWENAEKERIQAIQDRIANFDAGRVDISSSIELILSVISEVEAIEIDESFGDLKDQAKLKKYECLEVFAKVKLDREKFDTEQAELERLRIAEQERMQQERDAQIALEATQKAQREAEEKARLEAERVEREKVEQDKKIAREKYESEQREARLKAEHEASILREEALKLKVIEDTKQAEIAKQNAIEAERKRIEADRVAKEQAEIKAQQAREADKAHKEKVCNSILVELDKIGINSEIGKELIRAIHKGLIPNISIKF